MEIIKYGYVIFLQIIPLVSSGAITEREREREIPFCSFVMAKKRENNSWKPPDFSGDGGYKGRDIFEFQARRHKGDHVEV